MFAALGFLACSQDVLRFGMREGDVLLGLALLLPRIRFFLLLLVFGASNGPLCPRGSHPYFLEFGKLLDDLLQGTASGLFGTQVALA